MGFQSYISKFFTFTVGGGLRWGWCGEMEIKVEVEAELGNKR